MQNSKLILIAALVLASFVSKAETAADAILSSKLNDEQGRTMLDNTELLPPCTTKNIGQAFYVEHPKGMYNCQNPPEWTLALSSTNRHQNLFKKWCHGFVKGQSGTTYRISMTMMILDTYDYMMDCAYATQTSSNSYFRIQDPLQVKDPLEKFACVFRDVVFSLSDHPTKAEIDLARGRDFIILKSSLCEGTSDKQIDATILELQKPDLTSK